MLPLNAISLGSHLAARKRNLFALLSAEASTLVGTESNCLVKKIKNQHVSEVRITRIHIVLPTYATYHRGEYRLEKREAVSRHGGW